MPFAKRIMTNCLSSNPFLYISRQLLHTIINRVAKTTNRIIELEFLTILPFIIFLSLYIIPTYP